MLETSPSGKRLETAGKKDPANVFTFKLPAEKIQQYEQSIATDEISHLLQSEQMKRDLDVTMVNTVEPIG